MSTFKSVVTTLGQARIAAAIQAGTDIKITQLAVGDGNGNATTPVATQTKLVKEVYRTPLNSLKLDASHANWIIAEAIISASVGGFWMREMGLFADDGTLIAVCNMADTYKPTLAEGSGRTQTLRMVITVSDTEAITLIIDDSIVVATEGYVNDLLAAHEKSRNHPDGTTAAKGFVQLSSSVTSDSETLAATPKAVKAANDNANGRLPSGGTAVAASKLATSRKIAGVAFDGTADISIPPANVGALPAGGTAVAASKLATARNIAGVAFDGTKDISLTPDNVGALPSGGTAVAATRLATARKIAGVSFNGTADISISADNVGALPAGGTAVAATKLATSRKIAGVPFDGSADISLAAANIGGLGTAALRDVQTSNTDATSGRVMQVGAFGIGIGNGSVPFLSSIYDIPCSGEYNAFGSGTDSPTVGIPDDSGNTRFAVYAGNVYASQYLVTLTSNVHFYVGFVHTANKTVAWSKFYNTSNKPSASDVGALPSGGTAVAADKLATARTIAGVSFNGTANIAIPAGNVGAYTKAEADARYSLKNTASKAANGWFKDASSGMIFQWGNNSTVGSSVTLPTSFPNACASFVVTDRGIGKVAFAGNASQNTFTVYGGGNNLTYNWMAIGY